MGRTPTVDRDRALDIAEAILLRAGTGALTTAAVAKAVGVSEGGIQSLFGTRGDLIAALVGRWQLDYEAEARAVAGDDPTPVEAVRGHIVITQRMDDRSTARAAGMIAALIEEREHLAAANRWCRDRFGGLDATTEEGRRARLALYAIGGTSVLRSFGFATQAGAEWHPAMADIQALLDGML